MAAASSKQPARKAGDFCMYYAEVRRKRKLEKGKIPKAESKAEHAAATVTWSAMTEDDKSVYGMLADVQFASQVRDSVGDSKGKEYKPGDRLWGLSDPDSPLSSEMFETAIRSSCGLAADDPIPGSMNFSGKMLKLFAEGLN